MSQASRRSVKRPLTPRRGLKDMKTWQVKWSQGNKYTLSPFRLLMYPSFLVKERLRAQWVGHRVGCTSRPLAANNIRKHLSEIPPLLFASLGGKSIMWNMARHATGTNIQLQIKLTDQRSGAVTRGSVVGFAAWWTSSWHPARASPMPDSFSLLPARAPHPSVFIKNPLLWFPPLPVLWRRYQSYLALSRLLCSLRMWTCR